MEQRPLITDFTAGELSPKFSGRADLEIYGKGCLMLENWVPFCQGGIRTLPGDKYLAVTKDGLLARFIPFAVDENNVFDVELTDAKIRTWSGDSVVGAEIDSPYLAADLFQVQFCKVCNELYLVHPLYPIQVLTWTGGTSFSLAPLTITWAEGVPSWVANTVYTQDDVVHGKVGFAGELKVYRCITAGTSAAGNGPTTEEDDITDGTAHWTWEFSKPFSAAGDYPAAIGHFNGRMIYGGSINNRQTAWESCPWDYGNMNYFDIITYTTKQLKDEALWANPLVPETEDVTYHRSVYGEGNAFFFEIASDLDDSIFWLVGADALIVGTTMAEWVVPPDVTALDIRAKLRSRIGSARIQATVFGDAPIFVQGSLTSAFLREYAYLSQSAELSSPDLTFFAEQMLDTGVKQIAFSMKPQPTLFCVTVEGELAALLYNKQYNVMAWYHIKTASGTIESISVTPGSVDDNIKIVVNRAGGRVVERFDRLWDATKIPLWAYYTKVIAGATEGGLERFANLSVTIVNTTDGTIHTAVVSGAGVLTYPAGDGVGDTVWVGLPRICKAQTMRLNAQSAVGQAQMALKRINGVTARVLESMPFKAGYSETLNLETAQRFDGAAWTAAYTGDVAIPFAGNWDRDAWIWLIQDLPQHSTILALAPEVDA